MTTLILDANNLAMRAYHAARGRVELSADGVNTAPLLLSLNLIGKFVRQEQPERVVACWDGGRSHVRLALFKGYKAARSVHEGHPDDRDHLTLVREFCALAGIFQVRVDGIEADDLVADYAASARGAVTIVSGDKDFLQLVSPRVSVVRPGDGDLRWDEVKVQDKMGCHPRHLRAVMALSGDASDSIPGVPGFGTKTACKLLARYDWDLQRLLDSAEPKIQGHRDTVLRNLALVDLGRTGAVVDEPPLWGQMETRAGTTMWSLLMDWVNRYEMESIKSRLMQGTMWREPAHPPNGSLADLAGWQ